MGRELKRKEAKKNKNNNTKVEELDTKISLLTLIKITFFIILLLAAVYYVLAVFVTKEINISSKKDEKTENVSSNNTVTDKILASNIFSQKESSYYVYFYDFSDNENLYSLIDSKIEDKIYKVDTSSGLNSKYVTEEKGNKNATNLEELKVIDNTLIKVDNDKIVKYYEGESSIRDYINK